MVANKHLLVVMTQITENHYGTTLIKHLKCMSSFKLLIRQELLKVLLQQHLLKNGLMTHYMLTQEAVSSLLLQTKLLVKFTKMYQTLDSLKVKLFAIFSIQLTVLRLLQEN
jgi:hypothetical protein